MTLNVDINCFVGFWPFRHIRYRSVNDIRGLMDRTNTHGVLLTPMAGLFYKDTLSAVSEMMKELNQSGYENMWPIAVINPMFPGWQDDLSIMVDEWGCVAVRLFPNYHAYTLPDTHIADFLIEVQNRDLPLIISVRMEDERLHHWTMRVEPVSYLDITWLLRSYPEIRTVLCGLNPTELDLIIDIVSTHPNAYVNTSIRMPQFYMEEMVSRMGPERIVFGTAMPLNYPESHLFQLKNAHISEDARQNILCNNASSIFGINVQTELGEK